MVEVVEIRQVHEESNNLRTLPAHSHINRNNNSAPLRSYPHLETSTFTEVCHSPQPSYNSSSLPVPTSRRRSPHSRAGVKSQPKSTQTAQNTIILDDDDDDKTKSTTFDKQPQPINNKELVVAKPPAKRRMSLQLSPPRKKTRSPATPKPMPVESTSWVTEVSVLRSDAPRNWYLDEQRWTKIVYQSNAEPKPSPKQKQQQQQENNETIEKQANRTSPRFASTEADSSSRVGAEYQVARIPDASTFARRQSPISDKSTRGIVLWDPQLASEQEQQETGQVRRPLTQLIHPRNGLDFNMELMESMHACSYNLEETEEVLADLQRTKRDWNQEMFFEQFERFRKRARGSQKQRGGEPIKFAEIAKHMGCSVANVLVHYYIWKGGKVKGSGKKRSPKEKTSKAVPCAVCRFDDFEIMVICDSCRKAYHPKCIGLSSVPKASSWSCLDCKRLSCTNTPDSSPPPNSGSPSPNSGSPRYRDQHIPRKKDKKGKSRSPTRHVSASPSSISPRNASFFSALELDDSDVDEEVAEGWIDISESSGESIGDVGSDESSVSTVFEPSEDIDDSSLDEDDKDPDFVAPKKKTKKASSGSAVQKRTPQRPQAPPVIDTNSLTYEAYTQQLAGTENPVAHNARHTMFHFKRRIIDHLANLRTKKEMVELDRFFTSYTHNIVSSRTEQEAICYAELFADFTYRRVCLTQDQQRMGMYLVPLIETKMGYLVLLQNDGEETVFSGYRDLPDGSKGPVERLQLFRNVGDRIICVDGVSCVGKSFQDTVHFLKNRGAHLIRWLTMQDIQTAPMVTFVS